MTAKITHHVYSTLTADNKYTTWEKGGGDVPHATGHVLIKGGSNVINKKTFITPLGVCTPITDEQLALLESNSEFCAHRDRGFLKVIKQKLEPEAVIGDMENRDESAQLTPNDYDNESESSPKPAVNMDKKSGGKNQRK